jgi:hypothetical protein
MRAGPALHPVRALAVSLWLMLATACSSPAGDGRAVTCAGTHAQNIELRRIVVFGEVHGTEEAPKFVGNWICNLAAQGEAVVVGIEHPSDEQALLDSFMSTDSGEAAGVLLDSPFWMRDAQDGRTSAAMLELLEDLRKLRLSGADLKVVAVGPSGAGDGSEISTHLRALGNNPDAKVVVLLGNAHVRKAGASSLDGQTEPMFQKPYRAVFFTHEGGTAWACAPVCEVQSLGHPRRTPGSPGELVLGDALKMYDGTVNLGRLHASGPATLRSLQP